METIEGLWAVVPAGGAGTRLWPLSRAGRPKFLLDLTGAGRSMLQQTVDRLAPLVADRLMVVTGTAHRDQVSGQLPGLAPGRILAEPCPRDSMPAIGLAAALVERADPSGVIGSFAADQVVGDAAEFRRCVAEAVEVARTGMVVTLGVEPTGPATGFGYIHLGDPMPGFASARRVRSFTEKPDRALAGEYVASGEYRWNAGMFVAPAGLLLDELALEHPRLAADLRAIAADPSRLEELWPGLTRIAIDHAVAEPAAAAGRVATVPGSFGWDDLGDFAALRSHLAERAGPQVLGDPGLVHAVDATGLVVTGDRTVAVVGVADVVVVDTGDAVLVTTAERAQDVRAVVEDLRAQQRVDLV
ncbi:MAG: mannose-1-phosphate guanylyltransferase [Marmoricola sp.]